MGDQILSRLFNLVDDIHKYENKHLPTTPKVWAVDAPCFVTKFSILKKKLLTVTKHNQIIPSTNLSAIDKIQIFEVKWYNFKNLLCSSDGSCQLVGVCFSEACVQTI
jgi:hypothetical protein